MKRLAACRALVAAGLISFSVGAAAQTYVIDFGESGSPPYCASGGDGTGLTQLCGDGARIHQNYGDIAGVVNVTYLQPESASPTSLRWWSSGYNNLYGVAWADGGDANSTARIELDALGGPLRLTHFDLGAWPGGQRATHVRVWDLGNLSGPALFSFDGTVGTSSPNVATAFNMNLVSSEGFRIEWYDSAYNVGIDHITFEIAAVIPEPQTYAILLAGLGLLGFAARRRSMLST